MLDPQIPSQTQPPSETHLFVLQRSPLRRSFIQPFHGFIAVQCFAHRCIISWKMRDLEILKGHLRDARIAFLGFAPSSKRRHEVTAGYIDTCNIYIWMHVHMIYIYIYIYLYICVCVCARVCVYDHVFMCETEDSSSCIDLFPMNIPPFGGQGPRFQMPRRSPKTGIQLNHQVWQGNPSISMHLKPKHHPKLPR